MWYLLFLEFRPKNCLEIGVYRGQVVSLWSALSKSLNFDCKITGLSPFSSVGHDHYSNDINYLEDTKNNFDFFKLPYCEFVQELSTSENAIKYMKSKKWDLIYIDGNHDYEIALSDFLIAQDNLSENGIIVMDDSSLYFDYTNRGFPGFPGPSKVAKENAMKTMELIGGVGHNNIFRKKKKI
jgi:hypothetical protein